MKFTCYEKFRELPHVTKAGIWSASSFMFGIILGYVLFPPIFKFQLNREMSLRNKTDVKEMWVKLPFPLEVKVYIWNVTNPLDVQNGAKPILKEVGPYYYEKYLEKVDLIENKEEDSIEFNRRDTYFFKPELSEGLTGEELVYTPHIVIMATGSTIATEKAGFLKQATKSIQGIYDNPEHVFTLQRVNDLLFEGVVVNCNKSTEFGPKAVCAVYKTIPSLEEFEPNFFRYSLLGKANRTDPKRYKVWRGIKNITNVGKIIEYDGKPAQEVWNGDHCNRIEGTDATIFKPMLTEKDELWSFSPEMCRSIGAVYEGPSSYKKIKAYRYVVGFGDLANEPENHCFCRTPETCPLKGVMDITDCIKGPVAITLPHFLDADPSLLAKVEGLYPDKEKHGIIIDMEPISGSPMHAKKRIQINLKMMNIPQIPYFVNIPNMLMPMMWYEEGLALNKTYMNMLKYQLFYPVKAVKFLKWSTIVGGLIGAIYTLVMHRREKSGTISNVSNTQGRDLDSAESVREPTVNNTGNVPERVERF